MRQPRKVLWVVLSSMFFKEMWRNCTRGHGRLFASAKESKKKKVGSTTTGAVYWSYPIVPFGIVACTFLPTTFLKIAVWDFAFNGFDLRHCHFLRKQTLRGISYTQGDHSFLFAVIWQIYQQRVKNKIVRRQWVLNWMPIDFSWNWACSQIRPSIFSSKSAESWW